MSVVQHFVKVARFCGRSYLHHGGPTSRLEDKINAAGSRLGLSTDVWCTPTGIFMTVSDGKETVTAIERIRETSSVFVDFIFFGQLLDQLAEGTMGLQEVNDQAHAYSSQKYSIFLVIGAAFVVGFMASFIRYGYLFGATLSGAIAMTAFVLQRPLKRRFKYSSVFSDFISSILVFVAGLTCVYYTNQPVMLFVLGSLILIVPGLLLTSAISELAEHNFVSGTVKLVRSVLIIIAMGVAYLLVENLAVRYGLPQGFVISEVHGTGLATQGWFQSLGQMVIISGFCIFFHIPLRALPGAMFCGLASSLVLHYFLEPGQYVLASFLAAFTVGIMSLFLARLYKWPSQIFSTPGILILVPGLLAFTAFANFSEAEEGSIAYRVALTAGAIVFGLLSARMPFRFSKDHFEELM